MSDSAETRDDAIKFPELVFGLIGAVGTDSEKIFDALAHALKQVRYNLIAIRLIDELRELEKWRDIVTEPLDARYTSHMDAGNEFRKLLGRNDALALLGTASLARERTRIAQEQGKPAARTAYILRSLKTPEEVFSLRDIYGQNFFTIAAYSSKSKRRDRLAASIATSRARSGFTGATVTADKLIERDEAELQDRFGQNIREAFPSSDFFVDADGNKLQEQITRIVELIFGNTFHTPTRDEFGMFHAWAASLRSASLGRQVGAAICTNGGDLLATGCNEVPKAHGGQYWTEDDPDCRDHQRGEDSNDIIKSEILADLLRRLRDGKWLNDDKSEKSVRDLLEEALGETSPASLKKATLMGITEYGRMVHAEMAAIMQAARLGISVQDATIFCTTFPCHNCTKHIVAAGISRLIFIEPYPKSRASELHDDSIAVEANTDDQKHVRFQFFVGISPRQYFHLFSLGDSVRKEGSKVKKWKSENASPRLVDRPFAYLGREKAVLLAFDELLKRSKLR